MGVGSALRRQPWLLLLSVCVIALSCKETDTTYQPVELLTDPSVKPVVIYTFPYANSVGPFSGFASTVTVRFNKLMDLTSLRHAVHFISSAGDLLPDTSVISLNQGDVASITPVRTNLNLPLMWKVARSYALRIDSTATDINGNTLSSSFVMNFIPEPYFRVKTVSPFSGATNVNASSIDIQFNAMVDTSIRSHINISPPGSGLWRYPFLTSGIYDSSQVIFQNSSGFIVGRTYTISIAADAVDKEGDPLSGGFVSSFTTIPFFVTSTNPGDGNVNWPPSSRSLNVVFSDAIDTSTVAAAFRINPPMTGQLSYPASNPRSFTFTASGNFAQETAYSVTIDTSIRSIVQARMAQAYGYAFITGTANIGPSTFRVSSTSPGNGDTTFLPRNIIRIYFNNNIDSASARNAFSISPPVDGLISFPYPYAISFSPIETFALKTAYTVTVASSITSAGGTSLGSPYTFSFTTVPFEVVSTSPSDGETHVPKTIYDMQVYMSDAVDTATIRTSFSITPPVSGNFGAAADGYTFYFYPSAALQPYTIYSVTISTALHSKLGVPLAWPHVFSFATGN